MGEGGEGEDKKEDVCKNMGEDMEEDNEEKDEENGDKARLEEEREETVGFRNLASC